MYQEVMTAQQLAKYLQLDEQTIYRKASAGEIPAVYIGKALRFKKDVIDDWLRIASLRWTAKKRQDLRDWAQDYAKFRGLKESDVERMVARRRQAR